MEIEIILDTGHSITVKTNKDDVKQVYSDLLDDDGFPFSFMSNAAISKDHIVAIITTESILTPAE